MLDTIIGKSATDGLSSALESVREFNLLSITAAERLANFHLDKARSYSDFTFTQMRDVLAIRDAKTLQDFISARANIADDIAKQLKQDAQTLADMATSFSNDAQKLLQEQLPATSAAKPKKVA